MSEWARQLMVDYENAKRQHRAEARAAEEIDKSITHRLGVLRDELRVASTHSVTLDETQGNWRLIAAEHRHGLATLEVDMKVGGRARVAMKMVGREPWVLLDVRTSECVNAQGGVNYDVLGGLDDSLRRAIHLCLTTYWLSGDRIPPYPPDTDA